MGLRHNFAASTRRAELRRRVLEHPRRRPTQDTWESDHKLSEYALRVGHGLRRALQQRHPRPRQVRHRGDPLRLRPDDRPDSRRGLERLEPALKDDIALCDYTKLPLDTGGTETFDQKATVVVPYNAFIDMWTSEFRQYINSGGQGSIHVFPERPYKFCEDMFEGNLDCKTWDRGANQQEVINNVTEQFRNYYAFNAYRRGRTNWGIDGYLNRLAGAVLQPLLGGIPVLLLLLGLPELRPRRRSVPGVRRRAELDRGDPADARAGPALPDGHQPDGRDVPGQQHHGRARRQPVPGRQAEDGHPAAGREAVLHQLLRRLLLHVSRASARCSRSCRRCPR